MRQHRWIHESCGLRWLKSSRSGQGDACVEVALQGTVVFVRDSTNREGGRLRVPLRCWSSFTAAVRSR
ncbi:DUF397 domain-containing protein [Actinokineospora soli]|uniref:DUF397 domain-containing protein n=1 Tax=Actinokineospora soli TaxID=1048753 RepID=A0ABW2TUE3_9PSEU